MSSEEFTERYESRDQFGWAQSLQLVQIIAGLFIHTSLLLLTWKHQVLRHRNCLMLCAIATVDFSFLLYLALINSHRVHMLSFGWPCELQACLLLFFRLWSISSYGVVSLERYTAIRTPLNVLSTTKLRRLFLIAMLFSAIFSALPGFAAAFGFRSSALMPSGLYCYVDARIPGRGAYLLCMLLCFLSPIAVLNTRIVLMLQSLSKQSVHSTSRSSLNHSPSRLGTSPSRVGTSPSILSSRLAEPSVPANMTQNELDLWDHQVSVYATKTAAMAVVFMLWDTAGAFVAICQLCGFSVAEQAWPDLLRLFTFASASYLNDLLGMALFKPLRGVLLAEFKCKAGELTSSRSSQRDGSHWWSVQRSRMSQQRSQHSGRRSTRSQRRVQRSQQSPSQGSSSESKKKSADGPDANDQSEADFSCRGGTQRDSRVVSSFSTPGNDSTKSFVARVVFNPALPQPVEQCVDREAAPEAAPGLPRAAAVAAARTATREAAADTGAAEAAEAAGADEAEGAQRAEGSRRSRARAMAAGGSVQRATASSAAAGSERSLGASACRSGADARLDAVDEGCERTRMSLRLSERSGSGIPIMPLELASVREQGSATPRGGFSFRGLNMFGLITTMPDSPQPARSQHEQTPRFTYFV